MDDQQPLLTESGEGYTIVRLNRPDVLNALNTQLMEALVATLEGLDADSQVRCIIITGNDRAFAAGADIREMMDASPGEMLLRDQFSRWERIRKIRKPLIAAVNGFALGGGCELAMLCDMIVAGESARFGQPEINIGVMPGAGGTQRLTSALGKARAMEMVLTGKTMTAEEAYACGLVTRVVPPECCLEEARALAREIVAKPPIAVRLAKEAVLKAASVPLEEGLEFERKNFYLLFSTEDQKEGMRAFIEKRPPQWKGR